MDEFGILSSYAQLNSDSRLLSLLTIRKKVQTPMTKSLCIGPKISVKYVSCLYLL